MAEKVIMPRLGQSMEEGTIVQWYKREGDTVRRGEALLEVMTDKANMDVEAPADGVLRRVFAQPDETVAVNAEIAVIGGAEEEIEGATGRGGDRATAVGDGSPDAQERAGHPGGADMRVAGSPPRSVSQSPPPAVHVSPRARRLADEHGISVQALAGIGSGPQGRVVERDVVSLIERQRALERELGGKPSPSLEKPARMTPLAARIADESGLDIAALAGGLPGSRIMAEDVRRRVEEPARDAPGPPMPGVAGALSEPAVAQVIPFKGLKRLVAENVSRSRQTAPHVTLVVEVDMTQAGSALAALRPLVERERGVKLTYTDLLVKAAARGLGDQPLCNAALVGDGIRVYADKNIGVAVATESSLIVPVVKCADVKSVGEISVELKGLVERCRSGKQTSEDLAGGTFTITNLGAFGVDSFDPVIMPPQSCILGVGRIAEKPVAANGSVVVRPMMNLCLSFDHRVLDGAPAAIFLQRIKQLLEAPVLIFA